MIEGLVLEECNTWIVRYQSGRSSEVLIKARGKAWVDPALALPACAGLVRRFLAQGRPAEEVVFNWACWTHGDYVPRCPDQPGGGRVRSTADQMTGTLSLAASRPYRRPAMAGQADTRALVQAINASGGASEGHIAMAAILLAVNGLEAALAFVEQIPSLRMPTEPTDTEKTPC
jgi:hypothetical protein